MVASTVTTIHLNWAVEPNGERPSDLSPITGFLIYQKKVDAGKWEELRVPGEQTSHIFESLDCGTKYQYYVVAFNAVGKSEPSEMIATKTEGMVPVAPHKHSMLSLNATSATIHLDAWHDGSCPIQSFKIMYKPQKSRKWTTFPDQIFHLEQKQIVFSDLWPGTGYDLKITALNEAGPTEAQYSFTTISLIKGLKSQTCDSTTI